MWEGVKIGRAPSSFSVLAARKVLHFHKDEKGSDWNLNQVVNSSRDKLFLQLPKTGIKHILERCNCWCVICKCDVSCSAAGLLILCFTDYIYMRANIQHFLPPKGFTYTPSSVSFAHEGWFCQGSNSKNVAVWLHLSKMTKESIMLFIINVVFQMQHFPTARHLANAMFFR